MQIIIKDAKKDLYTSVEIHFSSEPDADVLPMLSKTLAKECPKYVGKIKKMDYSNINYHPIDRDIAILPGCN